MESFFNLVVFVAGFVFIAMASKQMGQLFAKFKLPLISGFLITGIIAGPFVFDFIPHEAVENLRFIDEISLAFIAFAAGSELYLQELKSRVKSIAWVAAGNAIVIPLLGSITVYLLSDSVSFMSEMTPSTRMAISLLAGAILVARSPSSAIAIVNELRAKGPFTQTVLGVTMIMDVLVIFLFALTTSLAGVLLTSAGFDAGFIVLLAAELTISVAVGYGLGRVLQFILAFQVNRMIKSGLILLLGFGVFALSNELQHLTHSYLQFELFLEPLLLCMIGSFVVINYTRYRAEFLKILHDIGPPIYIIFFTLTGASLALDVLVDVWPIALALFGIRLVAIFIGSFAGGTIAGDPMSHNRVSWMTYVTQAGVGLGLAKEVAVEFPAWGGAFATMIIAAIVLSQLVGPPLFKWAINRIGESHIRADTHEFDGVPDVIIFGLEDQSVALARQLLSHGWQVKIACREISPQDAENSDLNIFSIPDFSLDTLHRLDGEHVEAMVMMLSDEENYRICELAYENFGTNDLIVRLNNRTNFNRFHKMGVLIVDPSTAMISLFDHMVRSPVATSMLLGMEDHQDIIDIEVRDPTLVGVPLRNLRLPEEVLILSIQRDGHVLISHGYSRLKLGDKVTVIGSTKCLEEVGLRLGA